MPVLLVVPVDPGQAPLPRFQTYIGGVVPHLRILERSGRVAPGVGDAVEADALGDGGGRPKILLSQLDPGNQDWVRFADRDLQRCLEAQEPMVDLNNARYILANRPADF